MSTAHDIAFDPAAPAGERFDANVELAQAYQPAPSDLIPPAHLTGLIDFINEGLAESAMLKAQSAIIALENRTDPPPKRGMQSVYLDDLSINVMGEWFDKPSLLDFDMLRKTVDQTPILSAVVMTRIRQVSNFTSISEDGGRGFEIRHRDRKHKLTGEEQESAAKLGQFVSNCGWEFNPRKRMILKRDNFSTFMAKSIRDTLSLDAAPIETELKRNKEFGIEGFYAVDGTTIRLCGEKGYKGDDEIFAVQTIDSRMVTAFTREGLLYPVRNPRADVRAGGYGMAEPEMMVKIITGFLNALTYNTKGFDENSIPRGLLHLSGNYSADDLGAFRRYWNAMVRGINNAWSLPVLVSSDQESKASFEKFGVEFDEMYFSKWMIFLTSIVCAIYGMDPNEINFESFSASKSALSGDDTTEKLANSKDKGLRPLMSFYEQQMSDFIISAFDDRFVFRFVGLDSEDEKWTQEAKKLAYSVDELRAELGSEKWSAVNADGPDFGGAPLNPSLSGVWAQTVMQQNQPQPDYGQPGGDDDWQGPDMGAQPDDGSAAPPGDASEAQEPRTQGQQGEFGGPGTGDFGKAFDIWTIGR